MDSVIDLSYVDMSEAMSWRSNPPDGVGDQGQTWLGKKRGFSDCCSRFRLRLQRSSLLISSQIGAMLRPFF
jgi:hypothetical protein